MTMLTWCGCGQLDLMFMVSQNITTASFVNTADEIVFSSETLLGHTILCFLLAHHQCKGEPRSRGGGDAQGGQERGSELVLAEKTKRTEETYKKRRYELEDTRRREGEHATAADWHAARK